MRIAIAGFQHETNTFVPTPTGMAEFEMADSWPGLLTGHEAIDQTKGMNLPIAGFAAAAQNYPEIELVPILWCAAEPGGRVTDAAFDEIADRIVMGVRNAPPIDAIYLDIHGAMVTQSHEDGEGELLARLRGMFGSDMPIVASLDMHANITSRMVDLADMLCIFRTYPHIDMAQTGRRAFAWLIEIANGTHLSKAWRQVPYLVPLHAQHTEGEPARGLYARVEEVERQPSALAELSLGFTAADIADAGPSIVAYAPRQDQADRIADDIQTALLNAEEAFDCALLSPREAVARAKDNQGDRPVVIADVQDNPGAGASSDTTGLLRELVAQDVPAALLGLMHDPDVAAMAHHIGVGSLFEADLGGRSPVDQPFRGRFRVVAVSDGQCRYTGDMYGGGVATLGASAVLQVVDTEVQIVVTSIRNQCLDQAHFTHFGLNPASARIVCVKSTAHFRSDFSPLAQEILPVKAPGDFPCDLGNIRYRHLRKEVRQGPKGPLSAQTNFA